MLLRLINGPAEGVAALELPLSLLPSDLSRQRGLLVMRISSHPAPPQSELDKRISCSQGQQPVRQSRKRCWGH